MLNEKTIADLKAEHGDNLHLLEHLGREVVVKMPDRGAWKRFKGSMANEGPGRLEATAQFIRDCRVHPSPEELEAMFAELPALADTFAGELAELAGAAKSANHRKL